MFDLNTNILIVDDIKGVRVLLAKHLREIGYSKIIEAENGKEGLSILLDSVMRNEPIGLIICDLKMPVMDGMEFLNHVKIHPNYSKIPFLILSAESDRDSVLNAIAMGVDDYIIKPATVSGLIAKLESVYARRQAEKA